MTEIELYHSHERFMRMALQDARIALEAGDVPVGAVLVHNGEIVSIGLNQIESRRNDMLHAENTALWKAAPFLWEHRRECVLYSTLEPCALCFGAAAYSSVDRFVWGASDPLCATHAMTECVPYYKRKRFVLLGGVLEQECQELLNEYVRRSPIRPYLAK